MFYTVKDLTCTSKKPFKRQGVPDAFEDCYKMAGTVRLHTQGGVDRSGILQELERNMLGWQDITPKRSIQIGDGEVNSWHFYDETCGLELHCV
jgi:hypothetical protein